MSRIEYQTSVISLKLGGPEQSDEIELSDGRLMPAYLQQDQIRALRQAQLEDLPVHITIEIEGAS